MTLEYPGDICSKLDWEKYILANVPTLAKLKAAGKNDAYETWKILNNLTYRDHFEDWKRKTAFYSPYLPLMNVNWPVA
jgi:hypothetical protein